LSGRENIFLNGAILGMRRAGDQGQSLMRVVAFAEVERFLDTRSSATGSGMYVAWRFQIAALWSQSIF